MQSQIKNQIDQISETLKRLKIETQNKTHLQADRIIEYNIEITKYRDMRDGGGGGFFRNTETTIRELHFKGWNDSDFQLLLESIGEETVLSDADWDAKFAHEKNVLSRLFGKKGRPT